MAADCIFCSIIAGEAKAQVVAETDEVLVIKDIHPKATVHYLIIPKHHYQDLSQLDDCCVGSRLLQMARHLSSTNPDAMDYRLLINNGYGVGQRVFHLHMHFLAGSRVPEF
jgi:histidine triad (HIT) family protein